METLPPLETRSFDMPHPSRSRPPFERADTAETSRSRPDGCERSIVGIVSGLRNRRVRSSSADAERNHPVRDRWRAFIQRHLDGSVGRLRAGRLARWCGHPSSAPLDRSACRTMAERCHDMGFQVEPDPHVLPLTWAPNDELALVPRDDSQICSRPPAFEAAAFATSLGPYVAAPGGELDESRRRSLVARLETSLDVSPHDHRRLRALANVLDSDRIEDSIDRWLDAFRTNVDRTTAIALLVDIAASIAPRGPESAKRLGYVARELDVEPDDVVTHVRRSLETLASRAETHVGRSPRSVESFLRPSLRGSDECQPSTGEDEDDREACEPSSSDDEDRLRHFVEPRDDMEEGDPSTHRREAPHTHSVE